MPFNFSVHGHFYQPSREDPYTGLIPDEPGSSPYANWNECIHDRCYRPNAKLGNFRKISFDIGPTLLQWLEKYQPETYQQILDQEREIYQRYQVSNAMAQSYYHIILPLASRRDKLTQILWGIQDYHHRFGHAPHGLWLPETAVDIETLEILADEEIQFTILAPWQADVDHINTNQPYQAELPSGNDIAVFFYDGYLSGQVSFYAAATTNANEFINDHVVTAFHGEDGTDKLVMIASDGELYGHHMPFRDKFLAYLLDGAAEEAGLKVIFPAQWVEELDIQATVLIRPDTSWSCHHGVERWRGVCPDGPHSTWKAPLRNAFDKLTDVIDQVYLDLTQPFFSDPWKLRDEYIQVLLGNASAADFIHSHANGKVDPVSVKKIALLLEGENNRMKMYASDAWFFEEFDRIEPRNAIHYAVYAAWLVMQAVDRDIFSILKDDLSQVVSLDGRISGDQVALAYWQWLEAQKKPSGT
jgi:alpha-amylase/alpha-mannosidase (GH57 family)